MSVPFSDAADQQDSTPECDEKMLDRWFLAAQQGDEDYLNEHKKQLATRINKDRCTALMVAAKFNVPETIAILLDTEGGMQAPNGMTALAWQIISGHIPNEDLYEKENDIKIKEHITMDHFSCMYDNVDALRRITDDFGPETGGNTLYLLNTCIEHNAISCFEHLLDIFKTIPEFYIKKLVELIRSKEELSPKFLIELFKHNPTLLTSIRSTTTPTRPKKKAESDPLLMSSLKHARSTLADSTIQSFPSSKLVKDIEDAKEKLDLKLPLLQSKSVAASMSIGLGTGMSLNGHDRSHSRSYTNKAEVNNDIQDDLLIPSMNFALSCDHNDGNGQEQISDRTMEDSMSFLLGPGVGTTAEPVDDRETDIANNIDSTNDTYALSITSEKPDLLLKDNFDHPSPHNNEGAPCGLSNSIVQLSDIQGPYVGPKLIKDHVETRPEPHVQSVQHLQHVQLPKPEPIPTPAPIILPPYDERSHIINSDCRDNHQCCIDVHNCNIKSTKLEELNKRLYDENTALSDENLQLKQRIVEIEERLAQESIKVGALHKDLDTVRTKHLMDQENLNPDMSDQDYVRNMQSYMLKVKELKCENDTLQQRLNESVTKIRMLERENIMKRRLNQLLAEDNKRSRIQSRCNSIISRSESVMSPGNTFTEHMTMGLEDSMMEMLSSKMGDKARIESSVLRRKIAEMRSQMHHMLEDVKRISAVSLELLPSSFNGGVLVANLRDRATRLEERPDTDSINVLFTRYTDLITDCIGFLKSAQSDRTPEWGLNRSGRSDARTQRSSSRSLFGNILHKIGFGSDS